MGNTEQIINNLSPSIAESLHERVARLNRQLRSIELPQGLTQERLSALAIIESTGSISVTALAKHERVRPATMSRMISALESDGFVKRTHDKIDRRGVLVSVTPRGRKIFEHARGLRLGQLSEALASLPPDQLALMQDLATALGSLTTLLENPKPKIAEEDAEDLN